MFDHEKVKVGRRRRPVAPLARRLRSGFVPVTLVVPAAVVSGSGRAASPILVVGGDSRLGRALVAHLAARSRPVIATSRRSASGPAVLALDLAAPASTWTLPERPSVVVMFAAITSTAACEADPAGSWAVNVEATLALMRLCAARGSHLVLLSTNLVLSGRRPVSDAAEPLAPQGRYAAQKAELERAVREEGLPASILRIAKLAESLEPLLDGWARDLLDGAPIRPFRDLRCAPLPSSTVLDAVERLGDRAVPGLYQLSGDRDVGYDRMAALLAARLGVDPGLVQPATAAEMGASLPDRGPHTTLDSLPTLQALALPPIVSEEVLADGIDRVARRAVRPVVGSGPLV